MFLKMLRAAILTVLVLDCLLKGIVRQIALKDKDNVSLWNKGWIRFVSSIIKIVSPSRTKASVSVRVPQRNRTKNIDIKKIS